MTERERDTHKRENRALNWLARESRLRTRQLWQVGATNAVIEGLAASSLIRTYSVSITDARWALTPAGLRERDRRVANGLGWTV